MTVIAIKAVSGLLGFVLLASLANADEHAPSAGAPHILAGPVTWQDGATPLVSGTFRVTLTSARTGPLDSMMQGGACLVADLTPFGIGRVECATNADCNSSDTVGRQGNPHLPELAGYCAVRDGSDDSPRCWTRPGPANTYCKRTIDSFRLVEGEHELGPVSADPLVNGPPYPEWAVYACLAAPGHDRACGEAVSPHRQISLTPLRPAHESGAPQGQPLTISIEPLHQR